MKLNLKRPIIFFDIEATGLNVVKDRIVELCFLKIHPNGNEEAQTLRFNPDKHISEEASSVNGITDEDVKDCPLFKEKAEELAGIFRDCDLAGFNSNQYDVPMLVEEFARAGIGFDTQRCKLIDVQNIFHKMEPRTLSAAYKFYCGKDLQNAHTALGDTRATYDVLLAQLERYGDGLQNDVAWLAEFSQRNRNIDLAGRFIYDEQGKPIVNFGKYKGRHVRDVLKSDPGYYGWVMQGDFSQDTKQTLTRLRLKEGI
ncbi:MAG: 3'-5' exonuclease [Alloprevotella sp.]|nr:3'-5' exonuclease [Alloprevotella sp.]